MKLNLVRSDLSGCFGYWERQTPYNVEFRKDLFTYPDSTI